MEIVRSEIRQAFHGLLDVSIPVTQPADGNASLIIGTPKSSGIIEEMNAAPIQAAGDDGFVIQTYADKTVIAANRDIGLLYGTFHFLRLLQTGEPIERLSIVEKPRVKWRMLNHWDNLDGSIERGYAGRSLWQWDELPLKRSERYLDYARANASIGINGVAINNVNANARILSGEYLRKVAVLAGAWRPYGIRVFLSANFNAPRSLGGLNTADPLDPNVIAWWKAKAEEIYALIPDFGGFLVKANSEGQPGPQEYGRTHADGANLLADAIAPHGGTIFWRAFVYNEDVDPDRAKRAHIEFMALDGRFRDNVIIQVKNGPIDFQPREPFHPLFGALAHTPIGAELQITQEYLGQSKHAVFLGTMWKEFIDSDTYAKGQGATVGKVLEGSVHPQALTAIVGVANTGSDANWTGHHFAQANWYAFGRLAWDHTIPAEHLAEEWTRMTWTRDPAAVEAIRQILMTSHEAFVSYTMPLGLHHLIGGDHYAPMPWNDRAQRRDWTATYYHHAEPNGIGYDRTRRGSGAVEQYFPPLRDRLDDPGACPERLLLWFHHLRWDHKLRSGQTLWKELCDSYRRGSEQAAAFQRAWNGIAEQIDPQRHKEVADRFAIQVADASAWRQQILEYFKTFSRMEIV
jgi:alpha-glucuronidase